MAVHYGKQRGGLQCRRPPPSQHFGDVRGLLTAIATQAFIEKPMLSRTVPT